MEAIRLSDSADADNAQLAYLYLEDNKLMSAALLFEELSRFDDAYADETAEVYRRLGN